MAPSTRRTGGAVRTLGPLVPLGVALLHSAVIPPAGPNSAASVLDIDRAHQLVAYAAKAATNQCEGISNSRQCHTNYPEGCTNSDKSNTYDAYLGYLKNLLPTPESAKPVGSLRSLEDFQGFDQKSIALELGKERQAPFAESLADIGQGNIYEAIGYLYYAIPGGIETCNCKLKNIDDKDFHIGIGFDADTAKSISAGEIKNRGSDIDPVVQQTSVIVEMTPYYRSTFHPAWTLAKVQQLEGRQVKVVGQLIIDNEHNTADQNCAFEDHGEECWRGSAWELHPVTAVFVCNTTQHCEDNGPGWVSFDPMGN